MSLKLMYFTLLRTTSFKVFRFFSRIEAFIYRKHVKYHKIDWWIKWISSIIILCGMILTSQNIYPINLMIHATGVLGWLIVSIMWNDRSLIVVHACALTLLVNGLIAYFVEGL